MTVREHVGPAGGMPYFDLYTRYELTPPIDAVYLSLACSKADNDCHGQSGGSVWTIGSAACTLLSWQGRGLNGSARMRQDAVYGQVSV